MLALCGPGDEVIVPAIVAAFDRLDGVVASQPTSAADVRLGGEKMAARRVERLEGIGGLPVWLLYQATQ